MPSTKSIIQNLEPRCVSPLAQIADPTTWAQMANMDVEKGSVKSTKDFAPSPDYSSFHGGGPNYEETTIIHERWPRAIVNSFRRDPTLTLTPKGIVGANGRVFNPENAAAFTASSPLARKLKSRHLQMIAIGGSIGQHNLTPQYLDPVLTSDRNWSICCKWESTVCRYMSPTAHRAHTPT